MRGNELCLQQLAGYQSASEPPWYATVSMETSVLPLLRKPRAKAASWHSATVVTLSAPHVPDVRTK